MTVYKRKESSVWQCEFRLLGTHVRESTGCSNKIDAQAWEVKRREGIKRDASYSALGLHDVTLGTVAEQWLAESATQHRNHTNNVYRVRKLFGDSTRRINGVWTVVEGTRPGLSRAMPVRELRQDHLARLKTARIAEGNAPATWNRELSLIQSLIGFAESRGAVLPERPIRWTFGRNKAASLKMAEGGGKLRWLTLPEEAKLLNALATTAENRDFDQAATDSHDLTMFLLDTGARHSEVARVPWSAIDLQAGTINLYRSKTQNESTLTLPRRTLVMLRARREAMRDFQCDFVFPALRGRVWSGENKPRGHATQAIQRHIEACGLNSDPTLDRVTPHTFRDTFASRLVQAGVTLLKVSKLLGHSSVVMTQKYAHLSPDEAGAEAAAILNRLHGDEGAKDEAPEPHADPAPAPRRVTGWTPRLVA